MYRIAVLVAKAFVVLGLGACTAAPLAIHADDMLEACGNDTQTCCAADDMGFGACNDAGDGYLGCAHQWWVGDGGGYRCGYVVP